MKRLIIESSNKDDTPDVIEEHLIKAVSALEKIREDKPLSDKFLNQKLVEYDKWVDKILDNMVNELLKELGG